jgi:large subunit ribosomal protein L10
MFHCNPRPRIGESLPGTRSRQRFFFKKGGEKTLAISEKRKEELVTAYREWLQRSQAVILTEYVGLTMKEMDGLRSRVREAGGEFHVVKNTLSMIAFKESGLPLPAEYFAGSTAIGFAFEDAPGLAKVMTEFAKSAESLKIKGGYLHDRPMSPDQVTALAELPPLPVMRARLLGTLMGPASALVRTLAEPGRQVAAVVKAFAERESPAAA